MPSASATTAPLASTDFTVPCTTLFLSWPAMKLVNGSPSICLMPSEMRSRSTSIDSTTASASWPRSEEHTSEPSHQAISYAVFCLKKKKKKKNREKKSKIKNIETIKNKKKKIK